MLAVGAHMQSRLKSRGSALGLGVLLRPVLPSSPSLNLIWRPQRKHHVAAGIAGALSFPFMVVLAIGTGLPFGIAASLAVAHLAGVAPECRSAERLRLGRIVSGLAALWATLCLLSVVTGFFASALLWEALASIAVAVGPSVLQRLDRDGSAGTTEREIDCLDAYAVGGAVIVTDRGGRLLGSTWAAQRLIDGLASRCSPDIHQMIDLADRPGFSSAFLRGWQHASGTDCRVRLADAGNIDMVDVSIRPISEDRLAIALTPSLPVADEPEWCPDPVQQARCGGIQCTVPNQVNPDRPANIGLARVGEAVEFALRLTRPDAEKTGITLSAEGTDQDMSVVCDQRTLVQILINLLNNAVKFSNYEGRVGVVVRRFQDAALIRIVDRGVGIAPADQLRIFQLRERCSDGSRPGHGLGLAIVRDLVEATGGALCLSSEPGSGTTVDVRLPLADSSVEDCIVAHPDQTAWHLAAE